MLLSVVSLGLKAIVVRIVLALTSLLVFLVTFHMIRKERLREGYSILWLVAAGAIFLMAVFLDVIFYIHRETGLAYISQIIGVSLLLLLVIVFHFSLVISRLDKENKRLAQHVAVLANKLSEQEKKLPPDDSGTPADSGASPVDAGG